ncbi:MAG: DNA polymerase III subunit gamma/tau [Atopobiaceae bacterium]
MESLYRKYRPQTFADVVGQAHVVSTLEHAVLEGRVNQAYLFCGPRGTGKTTMARLLSKALECEQGQGKLPDGTCEQCQLIAEGTHPDVLELDAASRTGVDNVREEIISSVGFAPVRGRYKIYIIDEVHMLTTAAFNALLKTIEEPPSHVVFILCTTDPHMIPATILSRVQRFDFRPLSRDELHSRLVYVCEQEGFTYEDEAIAAIVRHAHGGMRDALSSLEQLSVFGDGVLSQEAAQDMFGAVGDDALDAVVSAMATRDVSALFDQVDSLVDEGKDLLQLIRELTVRMRNVYIAAAVGADRKIVADAGAAPQELAAEARSFGSADRVARILGILGDTANQMRTATNQRLTFEIALTKIARPEADLTVESLAERVAQLEQQVAELLQGVPVSEAAPAAAAAAVPTTPAAAPIPAAAVPPRPTHAPVAPAAPAAHGGAPTTRPSRPAEKPAAQSAYPHAASTPVTNPGQLQRFWKQAVDDMLSKIPSRGSLLLSSNILSDDGSTLLISLPKGSNFAMKMLERSDVSAAIEPYISKAFGGVRRLSFAESSLASADIARAERARKAARPNPAPRQEVSPAPAAPVRQAPVPAAPAPAAPASAPAPAPQHDAQPAPHVDLPWEEPTSASAQLDGYMSKDSAAQDPYDYTPADYDEQNVSYDEAFTAPADKGSELQEQEQPVAPAVPAPAEPAAPAPAPAPAPVPEPTPTPAPEPALSSEVPTVPNDVPEDLQAILENAFTVFGAGVKASTEKTSQRRSN